MQTREKQLQKKMQNCAPHFTRLMLCELPPILWIHSTQRTLCDVPVNKQQKVEEAEKDEEEEHRKEGKQEENEVEGKQEKTKAELRNRRGVE